MNILPILNNHVLMFNDGRGHPDTRPDGSPLQPGDLFISRSGDQVTTVIRDEHGKLAWVSIKETGLNEEQIELVADQYPAAFEYGWRANLPDGVIPYADPRDFTDAWKKQLTPEMWTDPEAWKAKHAHEHPPHPQQPHTHPAQRRRHRVHISRPPRH